MHRDGPDLDLEADLRQLLLGELCDSHRERGVGRVEDGLGAAEVAARQRTRPREVRALERIDVGVPEAGHQRRYVLVGEPTGERAASDRLQRLPVEREVHGPAQGRVVLEERPGRVEGEHSERQSALNEEPRAIDAVLLFQPERLVQVHRHQVRRPVDLAAFDAPERLVG